jgi:hypothetical protein
VVFCLASLARSKTNSTLVVVGRGRVASCQHSSPREQRLLLADKEGEACTLDQELARLQAGYRQASSPNGSS